MIVLDAAAVPDGYSGARTRLRGLLAAYARLGEGPPLGVRIARGSTLLAGVEVGSIRVEEAAPPGGPARRALQTLGSRASGPLDRGAALWHSETIPPLGPKGVPALLTLHDLRWFEPRSATGAPWRRWAPRHLAARAWLPRVARACEGIVTVSDASAKRIVAALGVAAERVHVVPNATVLEPAPRLASDAEAALLERLGVCGRPFFLAVGHLEPRKGLELALEALARARAGASASAKLVLVGDGSAAAALRARARDLGIAERVVFAGPLDERSTASLYANAAALLFPSRYEGFGLPVHEARAQGCPVVARELPVLDELAGSDVTRLDANVEAWSAALERLAATSNRSGTARVASAPPRAAIPWEDAARKLARLYARLLPADRQDPRADVRRDHGPLLAQVAKALRETDPMALHAMGAPADEYDPEVGTIVPRLASARTLDDVERIVHEEFVHWFGASAGSRERFRTTATRIWETLGALGRRR